MAKSKRKVSSAQRDKFAIAIAKILKKKGVLSKQTKLHGGRYVSRAVLKKVDVLQHVAYGDFTTVKVSKDYAKRAKEEGYTVVQGNRIVAPKDRGFLKRIKEGVISGIKPVKGGSMTEVTIPFTADNFQELVNKLQSNDLDNLKLDNEVFAFSYHGNMSFRAFSSAKAMRERLEHYRQDKEIKALKLYRLLPNDAEKFILSPAKRQAMRERSHKTISDRRITGESYIKRLERINPAKAARLKKQQAARSAARREAIARDPAKAEEYKAKARARAKASYNTRKGK